MKLSNPTGTTKIFVEVDGRLTLFFDLRNVDLYSTEYDDTGLYLPMIGLPGELKILTEKPKAVLEWLCCRAPNGSPDKTAF